MLQSELVTRGDIARALGVPPHEVGYVLDSRPDIEPVARAGIVRLYTRSVIDRVRAERECIDAKRGGLVLALQRGQIP